MTEIIDRDPTAEELAEREAWEAGAYDRELEHIEMMRRAEYMQPGSVDDMLAKYQLGEDGITLEDIKAKKAEIRAKYPKPEKPEANK